MRVVVVVQCGAAADAGSVAAARWFPISHVGFIRKLPQVRFVGRRVVSRQRRLHTELSAQRPDVGEAAVAARALSAKRGCFGKQLAARNLQARSGLAVNVQSPAEQVLRGRLGAAQVAPNVITIAVAQAR